MTKISGRTDKNIIDFASEYFEGWAHVINNGLGGIKIRMTHDSKDYFHVSLDNMYRIINL